MTSPSLLPGIVGLLSSRSRLWIFFFFHVDIFEKAELMLFSHWAHFGQLFSA